MNKKTYIIKFSCQNPKTGYWGERQVSWVGKGNKQHDQAKLAVVKEFDIKEERIISITCM